MFSSILFTIVTCLIVSTQSMDAELDRPADYERDGIQHSYHVEFITGPMDYQPKPMPITLLMLKKVNNYEGVGDGVDLSPSFQFKANSMYQFDIKTDMPFDQIDYIVLEWQDLGEIYGAVADINFDTATITQTTISILSSSKKFCADKSPRNVVGSIGGATFYPC